jgi:hypothetical protein
MLLTLPSTNTVVFLPSAMTALFAYVPLVNRNTIPMVVLAVLVASGLIAEKNVLSLARQVQATNSAERAALENVVTRMSAEHPGAYVSGTAPVAGSIYQLDNFYGRGTLRGGRVTAHATDFGLGKTYNLDDPAAIASVRRYLGMICQYPGYAVFPVPADRDDPSAYLFTIGHARTLCSYIQELPCLGSALGTFSYEGRQYAVYEVVSSDRAPY